MKYIQTKAHGRPVTVAFDLDAILADPSLRDRLIAKGVTSVTYGGAQKDYLKRESLDTKDKKGKKVKGRTDFTLYELLSLSTSRGATGITAQWVDAAVKALAKRGVKFEFPEGISKAKASYSLALENELADELSTKTGDEIGTLADLDRYLKRKSEEAQSFLG